MVSLMDGTDQVAREEAAAWHARLQSQSVSNEDLETFYLWRESPGNARAFEAMEGLWSRSAKLRDDPEIARLLRGARPRGGFVAGISDLLRRRWRPGVLGVGLVSLVAVVVLAVVLRPSAESFRTGIGERLAVRLDDGSRVTLNTASRISVRFSKSEREIVLQEGQVMFQVAHDSGRPFRVISNGSTVTAVGTVFEVARGSRGTRVILLSGRVSVDAPGRSASTFLRRPGDTLEIGGPSVAATRSDPATAGSWLNGRIDFRDVPLDAAIAEVNRYTEHPVVLDAPREAGTRVSGVFATGDPEAFAATVEVLLPLRQSRRDDGEIHLVERR